MSEMSLPMIICTAIVLIGIFIGAAFAAMSITKKLRRSEEPAEAGKLKISKDTRMGELLAEYPSSAIVLAEMGMHCIGCPSHSMETLEQAAAVHGIDADKLVSSVIAFVDSHKTKN